MLAITHLLLSSSHLSNLLVVSTFFQELDLSSLLS